jgi:SPW repeat-containing protein
MEEWSRAKLCDIVMFFSPWLFSLSAGAPRQTASIIGLLIAVLSIAALAAFAVWEEWFNLVVGLWLIATPWLFSFEDSKGITVDVLIGTAVAALATFEILLTISHRLDGPTDGGRAARH